MESFFVQVPGGYTTIQDFGRYGYQKIGVPVSGSLDQLATRVANLLVGNVETSAVLEITIVGPVLEALKSVDVAITGADIGITINDRPVLGWQSLRLGKGDILSIQQVKSGARAYLAVRGGFDVPLVMGSRSTYPGGKLGGLNGRHLEKGDILHSYESSLLNKLKFLPEKLIPDYLSDKTIHAVPGPQSNFSEEAIDFFFSSEFLVTDKANRMGYRLQGHPIKLQEDAPKSIISEPCIPGSVQIPADEQPIILLVEQTVGGYSKIATIVSSDLPKIAQSSPGDKLRFENTDLKNAHRLYNKRKSKLDKIRQFIETC